MNAANEHHVAMWGCFVIGNLSTEHWQSIVFIAMGIFLLGYNTYREITK